jgi:hypothetical protein
MVKPFRKNEQENSRGAHRRGRKSANDGEPPRRADDKKS